ncbi:MAG: hypothetical protein KatS3mg084_0558 [Candidatus Dojkabacteria bacterium]|nr:MAG: hypothetical protein KatS3mg084_0558 [Candidatus Dojkabacteria bacterium]
MNDVRNILKSTQTKLSKAQESLGIVAIGMGIIILLTKLTSLLKSQLLVAVYGIRSRELDLFHAANVIPDFIFSVIVIGGINAALIPIFSKINLDEPYEIQTKILSSILNIFVICLLFISIAVYIFAPQAIHYVVNINLPNINNKLTPDEYHMLIDLLRILIFSPIILCLSAIFSSILQVKKLFWITAFAPLFYNIGIIITTLVIRIFHLDVKFLAYGVIFASVLHLLIQLPAIFQANIHYQVLSFAFNNSYVINAIRNTIPRSIGLASEYIAGIFQAFIALNITTGALNALRLATSLRDIPTSVFGLAIAQSIFPHISELAQSNRLDDLQKVFSRAIRILLLWTIPITVVVIVLRTPMTQLIFGLFSKSGDFQGTNMVSYTLLFLAISIISLSIVGIINRTFYALNDSVTPTLVSIFIIFFEISLTYALVNLFSNFDESLSVNPIFIISNINSYFSNGNSPAAIGGIALASSISTTINVSILIFLLRKKGINFFYEQSYISKKFLSGLISLILGLIVFKYTNDFIDTTRVVGVLLTSINSSMFILMTYYLSENFLKDDDVLLIDDLITKTKPYLNKVLFLFNRNKIIGVSELD